MDDAREALMAIDPGIAFMIVLAGGTVSTFVAVAMIHLVRDGRALRARQAAAKALASPECGGSSALPLAECESVHAALVRDYADASHPPDARGR